MLILMLISIHYLQKVIFSFEKGPNGQKSLLLRFPPPNKKKSPPSKISDPPFYNAI